MGRDSYARNNYGRSSHGAAQASHAQTGHQRYTVEQQRALEYWQQAAQQEATRVAEIERQRMEAELQSKLDQVGAELELIESINQRHVRSLRWKVFVMFALAAGVAAGSGWFYKKKLKPELDQLRVTVVTQRVEQDRLGAQLREVTEKARGAEALYLASKSELERAKKPEPAATKSAAPAPAVEPVKLAPPPAPSPAPRGKKAASRAAPAAAAPEPPAPKPVRPPAAQKACKCPPGDPLCGCI